MDPADQSQLRSAVEAQGALLGQHQGELVAAHQTMDSLVSQVTELTETISRMQTDRNPVAPVIERPLVTPEPRINNPPIYSGEPTMCRAFMIQCEVIFSLQPLTYAHSSSPFSPAGPGNGLLLSGLQRQRAARTFSASRQNLSRYSTAQRSVRRCRSSWQHCVRGDVQWRTSPLSSAPSQLQVCGMKQHWLPGLRRRWRTT